MAAFVPGTSVYVSYDVFGPAGDVMHERIVLAWVDAAEYVVVTPTYDVFTEELDVANLDLSSVRVGGVGGRLPVGVEAGATYRFDPPLTQSEYGDCSPRARAWLALRGLGAALPVSRPAQGCFLPPARWLLLLSPCRRPPSPSQSPGCRRLTHRLARLELGGRGCSTSP